MLSFKQTLQTGEEKQFTFTGDFLYLESAPGFVEVRAENYGTQLITQGAQLKSERLSQTQILIRNMGEAGEVAIRTGFGSYEPPKDGQTVKFASAQPVNVESLPGLNVESMPAVDVESMPAVDVKSMPAVDVNPVEIYRLPLLNINSMPALYMAPNQRITVQELPEVSLREGQALNIQNTPGGILKVQELPPRTVVKHLFKFTEEEPTFEFPENTNRKFIELSSFSNNTERAYFYPQGTDFNDGFRLEVGKSLEVALYGAFVLQGALGDSIQAWEYLA